MSEITFIVDDLRGAVLVEDNRDLNEETVEHLRTHLGEWREIVCARPIEVIKPPIVSPEQLTEHVQNIRIAGFYHDSLTEGPGRRSSVLFQFCPLKCKRLYLQSEVGEVSYNP